MTVRFGITIAALLVLFACLAVLGARRLLRAGRAFVREFWPH